MKRNLVLGLLFYFLKTVNLSSVDSSYELNNPDFPNVDNNLRDTARNDNTFFKDEKNIKNFYETGDTLNQINSQKYSSLVKTVDNYIQRYVSLFLITSNLMNHEIKDLSETINIDLEISVAGKDLAFLQKYVRGEIDYSASRDLSKLDSIFTKIARLKERSYMEQAMKSAKNSFFNFDFQIFFHPSVHHFLVFFIILLFTWIAYRFSFNKSFFVSISVIVNSMIIWESLNSYWKKLKEVELEIYVKTIQLRDLPKNCDPANRNWYHSLSIYLFGDNCLQYYKNLNKTSVEEVSFFQCIVDTYALYFIKMPFKVVGASLRDFTGEITANSWMGNLLFFPLVPTFLLIFGIFILILWGKQLKVSFFGTSLEVGNSKPVPMIIKKTGFSNHAPKMLKDSKKLKIASKTKFPRHLPIDMGRRRNSVKQCKNCECFGSESSDNYEST